MERFSPPSYSTTTGQGHSLEEGFTLPTIPPEVATKSDETQMKRPFTGSSGEGRAGSSVSGGAVGGLGLNCPDARGNSSTTFCKYLEGNYPRNTGEITMETGQLGNQEGSSETGSDRGDSQTVLKQPAAIGSEQTDRGDSQTVLKQPAAIGSEQTNRGDSQTVLKQPAAIGSEQTERKSIYTAPPSGSLRHDTTEVKRIDTGTRARNEAVDISLISAPMGSSQSERPPGYESSENSPSHYIVLHAPVNPYGPLLISDSQCLIEDSRRGCLTQRMVVIIAVLTVVFICILLVVLIPPLYLLT